MLFEMLTGVTPFAAETLDEMYQRVLFDDLSFPVNFDADSADLITGLLRRDPFTRLSDVYNVRTHPYFVKHLNWKDVHAKRIQPSYIPARQFETDLRNFDPEFLNMSLAVDDEDSSLYKQRWHPNIRPAGLNKNAFRGYSYVQDENHEVTYQSEMSFSSEEYISDDEDGDYNEYYRMAEQAMIDSLAKNLPVPPTQETGLKRSLRPSRSIGAFNYNQDTGTPHSTGSIDTDLIDLLFGGDVEYFRMAEKAHEESLANKKPSQASLKRSIDASAFNYNQDMGHQPTTYDTNDATNDLIDRLFDDMQVPSFARGPTPSSKKDLRRPLSTDRSTNRLDPVPFNYNQNIRNSKIMNSTVKDDDASTWRS